MIEYETKPRIIPHNDPFNDKLVSDIVSSRAILGARLSLFAAVDQPELPLVHDPSFGPPGAKTSVKKDTDLYAAAVYDLGYVLGDASSRIPIFRQLQSRRASIVLCRNALNDAYHQNVAISQGAKYFTLLSICRYNWEE